MLTYIKLWFLNIFLIDSISPILPPTSERERERGRERERELADTFRHVKIIYLASKLINLTMLVPNS